MKDILKKLDDFLSMVFIYREEPEEELREIKQLKQQIKNKIRLCLN